jgi:hypothetical protein
VITTSAAGQPLPVECLRAAAVAVAWRACAPAPACGDDAEGDGLGDVPGDPLDADGLGDALGDVLKADGLGGLPAANAVGEAPPGCGAGLFSDAVAAAWWVVAPPTAQASTPSTARPPARANNLRRQ